ncbi:Bifunctional protein: zinc-containing alcohol dehydrogenase / quinone oxidoreductase (NADPH:quinone reductase) (EC / Similar to arginate lyase [Amycolatopsis camponoti]|uniref:Bifunctional protein: zinc-containing alcohol dehydrogenase / quinone oxidoreductase ( NADPH:quinone reductase) n=1 Tax=Amycolatopsis camponoti TaxID=2606593 RepID=A0A6I8LPB9_9PSEU|nr:NADP-dependent oxidoreductase [Amycolatopsis camponoti]VVJ17555.1 Bifunctional protein: zinc-containing alcohol dehydrogenase / quinone oxidoreductase (NADPH:quinone reductase) (EC / Similar to arginate lyase [Amycolatopsis camponoti]
MKVITQQSFGGPEVLTVVDAPEPRPRPTEVVVRVKAIGLNPLEARLRAGEFPLLGRPPFVLGWDISGVVEASPQTWRFRPGDEVFGMPLFPRAADGYAELVAAPALHLTRKPASLSHAEASALPIAGLTAWQGLVDLAGVAEGDRVLVHGGGGGVGHVAVQIAKALGAYVIATASGDKAGFVEELGADEVVDYTAVDFTGAVRDVDVVLDTIGGETAERSLGVLRPGGHLVTAVAEENADLAARCEAAGSRFSGIAVDPDPVALRGLADLVDRGRLRGHVQETFPFERIADAHRLLDRGHLRGKLVLTMPG